MYHRYVRNPKGSGYQHTMVEEQPPLPRPPTPTSPQGNAPPGNVQKVSQSVHSMPQGPTPPQRPSHGPPHSRPPHETPPPRSPFGPPDPCDPPPKGRSGGPSASGKGCFWDHLIPNGLDTGDLLIILILLLMLYYEKSDMLSTLITIGAFLIA